MWESRQYGSVRGALSNERPYRVVQFAASHMSARATKRRAAAAQQFGRNRSEADVGLLASRSVSGADDPEPTSAHSGGNA
jgi:hypothetical protein